MKSSRRARRPRAGPRVPASAITTARIYDPPTSGQGTRLLIMRLWPRGIRKERVDGWLKELGPVAPLLRDFRSGRIDWPEYTRRYLEGLERDAAREAVARALDLARQGPVTLLCGCPDENRCHRSLLRGYLAERLARGERAHDTSPEA